MAPGSFPKYPTLRKRIALELFRLIKRNESKTHKLHTLFSLRERLPCLQSTERYATRGFPSGYR